MGTQKYQDVNGRWHYKHGEFAKPPRPHTKQTDVTESLHQHATRKEKEPEVPKEMKEKKGTSINPYSQKVERANFPKRGVEKEVQMGKVHIKIKGEKPSSE